MPIKARSVVIVAFILAGCASHVTAQRLAMHVDAEQRQYVIREPLKLRVALINVSTDTLPIASIKRFNSNMEYLSAVHRDSRIVQ